MVTPQSLLITAFVMLALALALAAYLYGTDHKARIERAAVRVILFLGRTIALPFVSIIFLAIGFYILFRGWLALSYRVLAGHVPHTIKLKVEFAP